MENGDGEPLSQWFQGAESLVCVSLWGFGKVVEVTTRRWQWSSRREWPLTESCFQTWESAVRWQVKFSWWLPSAGGTESRWEPTLPMLEKRGWKWDCGGLLRALKVKARLSWLISTTMADCGSAWNTHLETSLCNLAFKFSWATTVLKYFRSH